MKKLLSIILAVSMITAIFAIGSPASAEESYRITYSAKEITDIDTIVMLATAQKTAEANTFSLATPDSVRASETSDELTYTQLLEVREYADGTEEKFVVTNTVRSDEIFSVSTTQTAYAYTHVLTFYYRLRSNINTSNPDLSASLQIKPIRCVLRTTKNNLDTPNITGIEIGYCSKAGGAYVESDTFSYNNSASLGAQTFTHYSVAGYQNVSIGSMPDVGTRLLWRARAYIDYANGLTSDISAYAIVK